MARIMYLILGAAHGCELRSRWCSSDAGGTPAVPVQTNVAAWGIVFLSFVMGANWSPVGSAQQYQGSVRYGIVARAASRGRASDFVS